MIRTLLSAVVALVLCVGVSLADDVPGKAVKAQMVKGTIKLADASKKLLIVNQKVKNETVERELSIGDTVKFVIKDGKEEKSGTGPECLTLLENQEGAMVQVKCDKDVNVIQITVTLKKK